MWLRWTKGRIGSGYDKFMVLSLFFFDIFLIRFPTGSEITTHTDPVPRFKHLRLNFVVKQAEGGEFICPKAYINRSRVKWFRPDIHEHSVSPITKGTRYVLSFGWLWP